MPRRDAVTLAAWRFDAIGTAWQVDTPRPLTDVDRAGVADVVRRFDADWSRFRDDSWVARVAREPGPQTLPEHGVDLLGLYTRLHRITAGAVNPLVGGRLADLGFDASYSLRAAAAPAAVPAWSSVQVDGDVLRTERPVLLDVGAAGKGLLVDLVAERLRAHAPVVDAAGDVRNDGPQALRVALEHPLDPSQAVGVAELAPGRSLCASATNRRAWGEGLHHVLDARSGEPVRDVLATWAVAHSAVLADGAATAAFFTAPPHVAAALGVHVARLRADGRIEADAAFPAELFTAGPHARATA